MGVSTRAITPSPVKSEPEAALRPAQVHLHLEGDIDFARLQSAWKQLVERKEELRAGLSPNGNSHNYKLRPLPWQEYDLRGLPAERARTWLDSFLETDRNQIIPADRLPLMRCALACFDAGACELVWSLHPALRERIDVEQVLNELASEYGPGLRVTASNVETGREAEPSRNGNRSSDTALMPTQVATPQNSPHGTEEEQLAYWRKQLGGELPVLELPTDFARPAVLSYRGAQRELRISRTVTEKLRQVSQEEGATLFMTLLAAFDALLARYSGQEELVVGTPVANWANTIALRVDVSGNPRFRELVRRVKRVALEGYEHQDVLFEKVVKELQAKPDLSRTPLFQVMFVLQNAAMPEMKAGPAEIAHRAAKSDLTMTIVENEEQLTGVVEYNTTLFEAGTIERMVGHWGRLLEGIAEDAEQRVWELPLMKEEERHQVVEEWNQTEGWYPQDKTIVELFEEQVERTPNRVAVVYEGQSLTYEELNQRANQLGRRLRGLGVGPDQLVGLCMKRSLEMVAGLIGVLKAGGAYVPLEPDYPRERLDFMVADTGVRVVLSTEQYRGVVEGAGIRVLSLDAEWSQVAAESGDGLESGARPENLAYVIYTSGSTGKPKGVMNTHKGLCNRLWWMQQEYRLGESDRVLQKTPYSFDVSVWEFLWPLMTGARLIVARPEGHRDSRYLAEVVEREQITTMHFVPSMLQAFVEEKELSRCGSLRRVICSGEALSAELQERFYARLGAELHNLYGPTEAAIDVTYWACERGQGRRTVPIGRPISNLQIYILDRYGNPVPVGVPGELHIGGVGLARGYLNRPELTAEKFVENPFREEPGARLYKTGDLARYRADGVIEYIGRIDHQVKIRGFRIELGEIEAALKRHEDISECVVLAREDAPGQKRLVAYVVQKERPLSATELRNWLKDRLPEYMVPVAFVTLPAIPVTQNGKMDRGALPAPDAVRPRLKQEDVAPRMPAEEIPEETELIAIWEAVLNTRPIRPSDDFFELGGQSLLALRLMAEIENAMGVELPLASLLEAPTVQAQAQLVRKYRGTDGTEDREKKQYLTAQQLPFFYLGGDPTFRPLSQRLSELREFHSLGVRTSLLAKLKDPSSLECIAEEFAKNIRERRPEGPYMLGGWCAHGLLAFETARQLQAQGHEVAQVVMLETANPLRRNQYGGWKRAIAQAQLKLHLLKFEFAYLRQLSGPKARDYISGRIRQKLTRMKKSLGRALKITSPNDSGILGSGNPLDALYAAASRYSPKPYQGSVVLIRSQQRTYGFGGVQDLGWGELLGQNLEICETPGNHYTIYMHPNVDALAHKIHVSLRRAEEKLMQASAAPLAG
jgi:amino acid adenylation domain-containing protein